MLMRNWRHPASITNHKLLTCNFPGKYYICCAAIWSHLESCCHALLRCTCLPLSHVTAYNHKIIILMVSKYPKGRLSNLICSHSQLQLWQADVKYCHENKITNHSIRSIVHIDILCLVLEGAWLSWIKLFKDSCVHDLQSTMVATPVTALIKCQCYIWKLKYPFLYFFLVISSLMYQLFSPLISWRSWHYRYDFISNLLGSWPISWPSAFQTWGE